MRTIPLALTPTQTEDARAITDAWNADRKRRGLDPLSLCEAITEVLIVLRGLVCGTEE
jgi:hypothetical protein